MRIFCRCMPIRLARYCFSTYLFFDKAEKSEIDGRCSLSCLTKVEQSYHKAGLVSSNLCFTTPHDGLQVLYLMYLRRRIQDRYY